MYAYRERRLVVRRDDAPLELTLAPREWEVVSASRVHSVHGSSVRWAPLGLLDMLNGNGALLATGVSTGGFGRTPHAHALLSATGKFGAYCVPAPRSVEANGVRVPFEYDEASGLLTVQLGRGASPAELSVRWR